MKTITLKKAFELLKNCEWVIVDHDAIARPSLIEIKEDPENEFLFFSYIICLEAYYNKFLEGNNQEVRFLGGSIFLEDHEGDEVELTLLKKQDIEQELVEVEIKEIIEIGGFDESDLDEAVHEVANCIGSSINNNGLESQVRFIVENGFDVKSILEQG